MKNRKLSRPIFRLLVLSLVANPALLSSAQTAVSNPSSTAPQAQPSPASASAPATEPAAAPQPSPPTPASGVAIAPTPKHTISYTVMKGDSLTSIARKFNSTRKALRQLNNLTASTVTPGEVLLVPFFKKSARKATAAAKPKPKPHPTYLVAQPAQNFDGSAPTLAPGPVQSPNPDEAANSSASDASGVPEKPAPIAKLVSPAELAAEPPPESVPANGGQESVAPKSVVTATVAASSGSSKSFPRALPVYPSGMSAEVGKNNPSTFHPPTPQPAHRSLAQILGFDAPSAPSADDWAKRFLESARALGNQGIGYNEDWRPPGESRSWTMDCSNTARYLYKVTAGIELPRTASDQYYYLHQQGKAWDVPRIAYGLPDTNFLRRNLKPGDLLFWENTYRPDRQPPITHVMIFLGVNERGQWIMAGSQSSGGGEHNRRNGGPDIYPFRPSQPCGGYTTWLGLVHHRGRFCAFGRPLEADPTKLADAGND